MILEVYLQNETGIPSNQALVNIDGVETTYDLSLAEQAMLFDSFTAMQAEDVTNLGWLIETTKPATYISIILKYNYFDTSVTNCDKGGNVFEDSTIYTPLNDLVTSILDTLIP